MPDDYNRDTSENDEAQIRRYFNKDKYVGIVKPLNNALEHPTEALLETYTRHGCPGYCDRDWTTRELEVADTMGSQDSALGQ